MDPQNGIWSGSDDQLSEDMLHPVYIQQVTILIQHLQSHQATFLSILYHTSEAIIVKLLVKQ